MSLKGYEIVFKSISNNFNKFLYLKLQSKIIIIIIISQILQEKNIKIHVNSKYFRQQIILSPLMYN